MDIMNTFETNRAEIITKIERAAKRHGHDPARIELIAVSKQQPPEKITEALESGHRIFGENRVQESYMRWKDFKPLYPDIKLHLIGPLQTNKVKDAVALFDCIHTLDREKLARALSDEIKKTGRSVPCFIQVNTGGESQKSGVAPENTEALLNLARNDCGLNIMGLMCIPPVDEPPALHFALLKKMADQFGLNNLSMGMSADYERAVALGATHIRIGTGLFGERL
jgi:pyridoxal phosphate enzyme (YggS family)